ncbi:MAG: hypothetical protein JNM93_10510 [Bacteriovoracaceae bacterium]|nr:hypothetical protein [Bacteriovoracaceae bacterium]
MKVYFLFLIITLLPVRVFAEAQTCSRVVQVNYQEILVDASSSKKGEGLRYYLEKDDVACKYLNEYQNNIRPTWQGAIISSIGSFMILYALLSSGNSMDKDKRNFFVMGGASVIFGNYLYAKTRQFQNEDLLNRAIDEYNQRNIPKIYFSPARDVDNSPTGLGIGITQEF